MSAHETLWQRWTRHADERPSAEAIVHYRAEQAPVRLTWSELVAAAGTAANRLHTLGVRKGDVCALVLRHHAELYPAYLGVCALGAIPAILAYPNARLHPDKFVAGLSGMARRSGLDYLLTERELEPVIRPLVMGSGATVRGLLFPLEWNVLAEPAPLPAVPGARSHEPCLLQHSSGTTGLQKAVVLSHAAVLDHVDRYAEAIELSSSDKVVSWLPLYHDMGLIAAFHLALARSIPLVQLDPFEWVLAPGLLLQALHEERGTLSWLPNFAYNLLADRVRDDDIEGVRLEHTRLLVNCSEPVRHDSHSRFFERYRARGLAEGTLSACYAMAETTFAVTQTRPGERARVLMLDRAALKEGRAVLAGDETLARACVSSGYPLRGCRVRVVGAEGEELGSGRTGELWIRSESMFDGYRNAPEETARSMVDGWYRSGDLGFEWEGEIYVTGRVKDIIIHAGKNLFPEDIEDAVSRVPGVIPGRVVAFGIDDASTGTEAVCVIAESELTDVRPRKTLELAILKAAMAIDVTLGRVVLAPPRWLVKSSSGKLSRKTNKERLLEGELTPSPTGS